MSAEAQQDRVLTNEELDQLDAVEQALEEAEAPSPGPKPPCDIYMNRGGRFIVEDFDAWEYTPTGIFATGHFMGHSEEEDVVIPYTSVNYQQLHFPKDD